MADSEGATFVGFDIAVPDGFLIAAGEPADFFAVAVAVAATPFGWTFRTEGEVAVVLGANEVRVAVVVLPGAVSDVFVAVALTSSGFLPAAVVLAEAGFAPVVLVVVPVVRGTVLLVVVVARVDLDDAPSVVVVPLVSELFAATVLFAVVVVVVDVFEGTEALDTALEGREVTVRVVVVVVVDSRDELVFPAAAALAVVLDVTDFETAVLVAELALADFVVLDAVVDATFVRAAATVDGAEAVFDVAVFAASVVVVGFFAANDDLVDVALTGRSLTPFIVALGFAAVGAFLASAATGGLRAAPVVLLLPTRGAAPFEAVLSLDAAEAGFADTLDAGFFAAAAPVVGAFGLLGLLAAVTAAVAAAAATATVAAAATAVAETPLDAGSVSANFVSSIGFSSLCSFSATSTSGFSCGNGSCGSPAGSDTPIRSAKPCDACSSCSLLVSC